MLLRWWRMDQDLFREAMRRWASGVTVIACRQDGRTIATTVSAFLSLSLHPPLVLAALGPNATVLPFLEPHASFGISILNDAQARLATVFADPFPVDTDPFSVDGPPLIPDALVRMHCTVHESRATSGHTLIIAGVDDVHFSEAAPLVRFRRRYHGLSPR